MSTKKAQEYIDVGGPDGLSEGDRITLIGNKAMMGLSVGVLVDGEDFDPGKADRYIAKVLEKYPMLEVTFRGPYFKDGSVIAIKFEKKGN